MRLLSVSSKKRLIKYQCVACGLKQEALTTDQLNDLFNEKLEKLYSSWQREADFLNGKVVIEEMNMRIEAEFHARKLEYPVFEVARDIPSNKKERKRKSITRQLAKEIWQRDEGRCVECGSKENLEFDHIIPFSKGGATTYRNLQLLCQKCNRSKSANI